jgi:mono/diheme cytochrome c family protein
LRFPKQNSIILLAIFLLFAVALAACSDDEAQKEAIEQAWQSSAHGDAEAEAFTRWEEEITENCAKCHSTTGYHDFLGVDGSTPGQVDKTAATGTTVECDACHNEVSVEKVFAVMPSNIELTDLGRNADCMECHQGRASTVQVDEAIEGLPPDTVDTEISGPGVHNNPAGPTQYGAEAMGGYEYKANKYAYRYEHVIEFDTCTSCHSPHSLQVDALQCSTCHLGVATAEDFADIRTSNIDYDGDGDISEGMAGEIATMEKKLWRDIELYIAVTEGAEPLVVNGRFNNEAGDSYSTWTPRLVQAAFNYQYSTLSAGGYAHHPHYILQLLYDSIEDIGGSLSGLVRPE